MQNKPTIIPSSQHGLPQSQISPNALKVLRRLNETGFAAFIVGGGVRDLLLNQQPKDFDIATDAHPPQIKKLFKNCRLIGKRFRLAHIHFHHEIIEVATFRAGGGRNIYGTQQEDVVLRDFTINALYYNAKDHSIVDYTGGLKDLKQKSLQMIGDPTERYLEDPVRILRAMRLSAKLNLIIDPATAAPITKLGKELINSSPHRLFDETMKWYFSGYTLNTFKLLQKFQLFSILFPSANTQATNFLQICFASADQRIKQQKPLNPAFLFAFILWGPLQSKVKLLQDQGNSLFLALQKASTEILTQQSEILAIPKRFIKTIKEVWVLQYRMQRNKPKKVHHVINHPRFKMAYDFLLLRQQAGEKLKSQIKYWASFVE